MSASRASGFERREQGCADGSTVGSLVLSLEEYGILTLYLPTAADATPPLPPEASKTDSVAVAHLLRYPHAAALPLFTFLPLPSFARSRTQPQAVKTSSSCPPLPLRAVRPAAQGGWEIAEAQGTQKRYGTR